MIRPKHIVRRCLETFALLVILFLCSLLMLPWIIWAMEQKQWLR